MNYNILFKKPHLPGYAYGGIRYGFTSFTYDVDAPVMVDPTWGNITVPFTYNGVKSNAGWVELVGGLTTKVYKNFLYGAFCALPGTHQHEENRKYRTLVYPRIRQEQS